MPDKGGRPRKQAPEGTAARRLSDWLDARGHPREWLVEKLNITLTHANMICNGSRNPGLRVALKLEEITHQEDPSDVIPAEIWIQK